MIYPRAFPKLGEIRIREEGWYGLVETGHSENESDWDNEPIVYYKFTKNIILPLLWHFCCFCFSSLARTQTRKSTVKVNKADETNFSWFCENHNKLRLHLIGNLDQVSLEHI